MQAPNESAIAALLAEALAPFESDPCVRRLRVRLRELGPNSRDEAAQFRLLQRAARESAEFARSLRDKGFGDITVVDPRSPGPIGGALIQAFNRHVETRWER